MSSRTLINSSANFTNFFVPLIFHKTKLQKHFTKTFLTVRIIYYFCFTIKAIENLLVVHDEMSPIKPPELSTEVFLFMIKVVYFRVTKGFPDSPLGRHRKGLKKFNYEKNSFLGTNVFICPNVFSIMFQRHTSNI